MAISQTYPTNRLLNAWQHRMGVNPYLFNQVTGANAYANIARAGERVYTQVDRDYIAEGCVTASSEILPYLRTFHRPTYTEEIITLPRRWNVLSTLQTRYHWVKAIGERATMLIQAAVPVTYNLSAGTATLSVTTAFDWDEIEVFFRTADGALSAANPLWEIEPTFKTSSGGVVTITGHPSVFVKPSLWAQPYLAPNYDTVNIGDSADVNSYVASVDVYRVYPDATNAVTLLQDPWFLGQPTGTAYNEISGGALLEDERLGQLRLRPDTANVCSLYGIRKVRVKYLAGYPLDIYTQRPDAALETAFVRLVNLRLPQMPNTFDDIRAQVYQRDSIVPMAGSQPVMKSTPLGGLAGEIAAWATISNPPYCVGSGGFIGGI